MAKNLLDLETLSRERDTFKVDGVPYELLAPDDFSMVDQSELMRLGRKFKRLQDFDLDEKEAQKIADQLKEFIKRITIGLPDQVNDKLTDAQRMAIVGAFIQAMPGTNQNPGPASQQPTAQLTEGERLRMAETLNSNEFKQTLVS
jgi:hypothetical protein